MEIDMLVKGSSASSSLGTMTLKRSFEEAMMCFIFGPPEMEEKALNKVRGIIDFASKYKFLIDSD